MAKEVRYDYNGKEVGILSKTFKDIVVLQEDWISTVNKQFAEHGYRSVLKSITHWVREAHGEELTDAQAWLMLHHTTNQGVPHALRDVTADEKVNLLAMSPVLLLVPLTAPSVLSVASFRPRGSPLRTSFPRKSIRKSDLKV